MHLRIKAFTKTPCKISYNYQYVLHSAIYSLIQKSSKEYSEFLHHKGFELNERSANDESKNIKKIFKLFTFSKLKFFPNNRTKYGFENVKEIEFNFATPVKKSFEHLVLGIFSNSEIILNFQNRNTKFNIQSVETIKEPSISGEEKFICLSPICTSTVRIKNGKREQHFLNYMDPKERSKFIQNIKSNLIKKYKTIYEKDYRNGNLDFQFSFDPEYIVKKEGKISKLISFKNNIKIKAYEAPFTIKADPELIKIGYDCGFGEKNSAGFGMVKVNLPQRR